MKWVPPRSMADRTKWLEEHPWIAGCYVGFFVTALVTIWGVIRTHASIWFGLAVGIPIWLLGWVLFAVLAKRRFGERPDGDSYPPPTWRRPWSRASDRFVLSWLIVGSTGVLILGSAFFIDETERFDAIVGTAGWGIVAAMAWAERRRRRRGQIR
jgi:hypothetical protein